MKKSVILLSGGLDSATVAAIAIHEGFSLHAISFAYGQKHHVELDAARAIAERYKMADHVVIPLSPIVFKSSSLSSLSAGEVPKDRNVESEKDIPSTYVPARNILFLSYALSFAETISAGDIFIGVNALDYSGYPDCRPEFIAAFQQMANIGTKAGVEGKGITIHAPLINMTKSGIIRLGTTLGVDYSITHSCYDPDPAGLACGRCDSCLLRKKGFIEAGIKDPTQYASS
ncbi:MAG TPA: 7-cyano-7-deazaguanine synthase QueC [Spirochaetota bacterium]